MLSPEQIQQYERDGFLLLPGLVDLQTLTDLNQRFLDIVGVRQPVAGAGFLGWLPTLSDLVVPHQCWFTGLFSN